jgi:hypothetical protein
MGTNWNEAAKSLGSGASDKLSQARAAQIKRRDADNRLSILEMIYRGAFRPLAEEEPSHEEDGTRHLQNDTEGNRNGYPKSGQS